MVSRMRETFHLILHDRLGEITALPSATLIVVSRTALVIDNVIQKALYTRVESLTPDVRAHLSITLLWTLIS